MKTKLYFLLKAAIVLTLFGCSTLENEKLPAGDIDIYNKYANEIETLHNKALRPDSKPKYEAALTLYKNIDFSFVRDIETLNKIFGAQDAHLGNKYYEKQQIIFLYRYQGKRVRFVFLRYNDSIIHSECTDQINTAE
jgi:hypothetical protein